jgi:formate hydrogenlyase subunit 3/multisubunit Na+/H+ antiporter MnhD subunit
MITQATLAPGHVLLAAAIGWPVVLACAWLVPAVRRSRAGTALAATMALPALAAAFVADTDTVLRASGVFTHVVLGIDPVGRAFLLLTAVLWGFVGVHAASYMRSDPRRGGFMGLLLVTCAGNLGVTLAQDVLGFYLFFALMTFAAYGLVVHAGSAAASHAGRVYIVMAVLGEALLLGGMFALIAAAGDVRFDALPDGWAALHRPGIVATLLLFGFGVKAGMLPVHLWLPLAHPVAPTPASALLSGAMIKAGVLGWLRFLPLGQLDLADVGVTAMVAGVAATLYAAAVGVTQRDPKTVLAYSSVSQMGFLATGVGAALVLPEAAPLLILAVAVYALHHAFAKAALFLGVGMLPAPGARGHWTALIAAALPALVLAGAPLTSGAVAKQALKSALGGLAVPWAARIDLLLAMAAVGTTLLMARYLAALRRTAAEAAHHRHAPGPGTLIPWLGLVALSVAAGAWLPAATAPLGELPLAVPPGYLAAALWPLALGVILAATAIALRRRCTALTMRNVPAGDVVALLELGIRTVRRTARPFAGMSMEAGWLGFWRKVIDAAGAAVDGAARRAEPALAGPAAGAVICLLVLALFLAMAAQR